MKNLSLGDFNAVGVQTSRLIANLDTSGLPALTGN